MNPVSFHSGLDSTHLAHLSFCALIFLPGQVMLGTVPHRSFSVFFPSMLHSRPRLASATSIATLKLETQLVLSQPLTPLRDSNSVHRHESISIHPSVPCYPVSSLVASMSLLSISLRGPPIILLPSLPAHGSPTMPNLAFL